MKCFYHNKNMIKEKVSKKELIWSSQSAGEAAVVLKNKHYLLQRPNSKPNTGPAAKTSSESSGRTESDVQITGEVSYIPVRSQLSVVQRKTKRE